MPRGPLIRLVIFLVVLALLIGGCIVVIGRGGGGEEATNGAGGGGGGGDAAITFDEFQEVQLGATREQVNERFGEPVDRTEVENAGLIQADDPALAQCIWYRSETPEFAEFFEFCFDEQGILSNTNSL